MLSTPDFPHKDKLKWVHVITVDTAPHMQPWIDAITDAGAKIEKSDEVVAGLRDQTSQKIAIIIGTSDDRVIQENIERYETIFADPTLSVRYFLFMSDGAVTHVEHDRLRAIPYMAFSPHDCIERISRSLYKARLPVKLRKWFDVEITEEVAEIEQIRYRKVIFRTYNDENKNDLKYETTDLYIHNKELYEMKWELMIKLSIDECNDPLVHVQCGRMSGYINLLSQFMDKKALDE